MEDNQLEPEKPIASAYTGRYLKPGKNILELREVIVGQDGTSTVKLQERLFFASWEELKDYLKEYVNEPIKRRVP